MTQQAIIGKNGARLIKLPKNWAMLSPVDKVLWVHKNHRDITGGQPFEFKRTINQGDEE